MPDYWPWLTVAGLGAFHGLNPAMGWLFAAAIGLHRGGRKAIASALVPLAAGHALAIALVAGLFVSASAFLAAGLLTRAAGGVLILWALARIFYGHGYRVRFGMTAGLAGLFAWSFLMATAHGAGLMLMPALAPLCLAGGAGLQASSSYFTALAAVGLHTGSMLLVMALCAFAVYEVSGIGVLRNLWINTDAIWTLALLAAGVILLIA